LKEFRATFKEKADLKKPAIVDGLEHTMVHVDHAANSLYAADIEERIQRLVQEELKKQPPRLPEKESVSGNSTPPTIVIRDV
jgi:prophage DNA circulation protein